MSVDLRWPSGFGATTSQAFSDETFETGWQDQISDNNANDVNVDYYLPVAYYRYSTVRFDT